ncbi:MAG: hypothetical protein LIO86_10785 [Lachnospiraceae bacterium]|nr:hypothetical protein [Lachnospiraceae bacterium]
MKKEYIAPSVRWMEFQTEDILTTSADPVGTFTIGSGTSDSTSSGSSGSGSGSTDDDPWPDGWDTMFDDLDEW